MCGKKNCHSSRRIISHPPPPRPTPVADQGFPRPGTSTPPIWGKTLSFGKIFAESCMKMKEFGPRGSRTSLASLPPSLDPPMYTPPIISCGYAFHTFTGNFWDLSKILYISCKILYISCKIKYIYRMYAHMR